MNASLVSSSFPSLLESLETVSGSVWRWVEACGLRHQRQVLSLLVKDAAVQGFCDAGGNRIPGQRSRECAEKFFVFRGLEPFEAVELHPAREHGPLLDDAVSFHSSGELGVITNGRFSLEVWLGDEVAGISDRVVAGPIVRFRIGDGGWRGVNFLETRRRVLSRTGTVVEEGPIRLVYRYRVNFEGEGFYEAEVTVDAGAVFARVDERFELGKSQAGCGDQVVWDFAANDLPKNFYALDSGPNFKKRAVAYHYDTRLVRLAAWTQQSQHLDYVDGFALGFCKGEEVVGFITLEGGSWRGDKLNHLEAWTRRWLPGVPESRRDLPASAKADSYPGPERVAARGGEVCEPHFNVEGWIGYGRRSYALVLTTVPEITPQATAEETPLGHFDLVPAREQYQRQQSLLRQIHIQHGVMPLQTILGAVFSWPEEESRESAFSYPDTTLDLHFGKQIEPTLAAREMSDYLEARVYGFWEGSGIAYSNPVVSRKIAPEMFRYEWLVKNGALTGSKRERVRAHFAFLTLLFESENYYTGDAAMLPAEHRDSTEPSLAGMANQNFYTDTFNVLGVCAQVFHGHPRAEAWRGRFGQQWTKQLAFHVYPESGVWEESHTYYEHVLHTVLPTLLRRRADGCDDFFANRDMQKLVASALRQLTPRDAFMGGRRSLIPFGDHGAEPKPALFQNLSAAFEAAAPELAAQLAWASREFDGTVAPAVENESRPVWRNEAVQGLGIFFRNFDANGVEALFALRSGAAWAHHHNDDGSFQFYAKGRALVVDSCFGNNQPERLKFEAAGHSRWSLRDLSPVNFYWRFNRGWVSESALEGRFPYARCFSPVYTVRGGMAFAEGLSTPVLHWRTVVQLGATTFLILDEAQSEFAQVAHFHLAGGGATQRENRTVLEFEGGKLELLPLWGASGAPLLIEREASGDKVSGVYRTSAVTFDLGHASSAAFLLHVGDEGDELGVEVMADGAYRLRFSGTEIELSRDMSGEVGSAAVLMDKASEERLILDFGAAASFEYFK